MRDSPALEIIDRLREAGAEVAFSDDLVPTVRVADGELRSVEEPAAVRWDLVVVHTLHPDHDVRWLSDVPAVLDTTYRLREVRHRASL